MKQVGSVEVPQEAFLAVLNLGNRGRDRTETVTRRVAGWRREALRTAPVRTSTSTCRSARTAAATATSSPRSGARDQHGAYVDALLAELELERGAAGAAAGDDLPRRRDADVHRAGRARAAARRAAGRGRGDGRGESGDGDARACPASVDETVSTVCRSARRASSRGFSHVLERRAGPTTSAASVYFFVMPDLTTSRSTSSTASRARAAADLDADLAEALALEPEHVSCYELEAKPGTRFTHAHGAELERQAEAMESYFERVVADADGRRLPLVRDGELLPANEDGRDLRARHNLAYWLGRDYLGLGIGAVSTVEGVRRRNAPRLGRVPRRARRRASAPPRELEPLDAGTRRRERVMLGLRLDEPLPLGGLEAAVDGDGARAAGAARPGGPRRRERRRDARAHRARPLPRRRRHRRSARLEFACSRDGFSGTRPHRAAAGDPRPAWSRSTSPRASRSARSTSSSGPGCACRPRRFAASSPSSSGSACSRIRTRRRVGSRPTAATATTSTGSSSGPAARRATFPLDLTAARSEVESALQATTEMLSQVTRLLALVSAPPLQTATVRHVEVLLLQPQVVMVVVITSSGGVTKRVYAFDMPVDPGLVALGGPVPERAASSGSRSAAAQLRRRLGDPTLATRGVGVPPGGASRPSPTPRTTSSASTSAAPPGCSTTSRDDELGAYRRCSTCSRRAPGAARPARRGARPATAVRPRRRRARRPGSPRPRARRRRVRDREPHARRGQPARPVADGLRQGDPHGPRRRLRAVALRRGDLRRVAS